jgi:hypothetical protein
MRKRVAALAALGIVSMAMAWVSSTAAGAVFVSGLLTTPRDEIQPAASRDFIWSQNSAAHPHRYTEYFETSPAGSSGPGPRMRVNAPGTQGFSGAVNPTAFGEVIYQQVKGRQSDLKFFSPGVVRKNPPAGVNTPAWEYRPSASGAWILFGRLRTATHRRTILLFDLSTRQVIVLADRPAGPPGKPSATPGQVNGDFAVWTQCTATACNVWEYDIATATKTRLPNTTPGHYNYAPSVDATGTAYYAHGGRTCGGARIEKQPLGGAASIIWSLRPHRDVTSSAYALHFGNASPSLLYGRYDCKTGSGDVYIIPSP